MIDSHNEKRLCLKVALYNPALPRYRVPLYDALVEALDWDLTVLLPERKEHSFLEVSPRAHAFHGKVFPAVTWSGNLSLSKMYAIEIDFCPGVLRELFCNRYHLLLLSGYGSLSQQLLLHLAGALGIPTVLWVRSFRITLGRDFGVASQLQQRWKKSLVAKADAYVVPGRKSLLYLSELGVKRDRITVVGNPVDNAFYSRTGEGAQSCHEDTEVLFVGRLIERKGVGFLLEAFQLQKSDSIRLTIVGTGALEEKVVEAARKDPRIRYEGFVAPECLPRYYHRSDILVLPTLYDLWGLVVNEAMNAGLPIIATDRAGAAGEIALDGVNGYIVPAGDSWALAQAIQTLHEEPELRLSMGQASRSIISDWGIDKAVEGFEAAAKIALEGGR